MNQETVNLAQQYASEHSDNLLKVTPYIHTLFLALVKECYDRGKELVPEDIKGTPAGALLHWSTLNWYLALMFSEASKISYELEIMKYSSLEEEKLMEAMQQFEVHIDTEIEKSKLSGDHTIA